MTGKGGISHSPNRRLLFGLVGAGVWLGVVCALAAWWGTELLKQAALISQLQNGSDYFSHIHRMVFGESTIFFVLLFGSGSVLFWIYSRDLQRTRSLQAFFAGVTHELRTPLTSIRLQAESIRDNLIEENTNHALLDRLMEDTLRLEAQVERTLELARVEGGGALYNQPISVRPWLSHQIQSWREVYGARLDLNAQLQDVAIEADPTAMQVILRNLMENALRHSRQEKTSVLIEVKLSGPKVSVIFSDKGEGYSGRIENLGKLFNKGPRSQGAGVGLYLVRMLMNRMGGEAQFHSKNGFSAELIFPTHEGAHHG